MSSGVASGGQHLENWFSGNLTEPGFYTCELYARGDQVAAFSRIPGQEGAWHGTQGYYIVAPVPTCPHTSRHRVVQC